ncbi:hypothetical protein [Caballeronia sp. KNU42]
MAKWRTQSDYGHVVIDRYLRMKRVTQVDPEEWRSWCFKVLFPMCYRKTWWHGQRSLRDIYGRVCDWMVIIEGEFIPVYDKTRMANVKKLAGVINKMNKMEKSLSTPCKP